MYRLRFLIALVSSFSLSAQDCGTTGENVAPVPLFAPMENHRLVPHIPKVNLVTGEYCEESCDLVVAGAQPLSIRRFYDHFSARFERAFGHWRINPEAFMLFNFEVGKPFVGFGERNRSFLLYQEAVENGFILSRESVGFTNSLLSGQSHPFNTKVTYNKREWLCKNLGYLPEMWCWWEGSIKDGSGRERMFKTDAKQWPQCSNPDPHRSKIHPCSQEIIKTYLIFIPPYQGKITEERLPNGNIIRYEYRDANAPYYNSYAYLKGEELPTIYELTSIKAYTQKGLLLGFIEISTQEHTPNECIERLVDEVLFQGSDLRTAHFGQPQRVINKGKVYDTVLAHVDASGQPRLSYDYYDFRNKKRNGYLSLPNLSQVLQNGTCLYETTYDPENRVSAQLAPVGPNGEKVPIARYSYQTDSTIVYDCENNKTIYRFNKEKRITAIEKYQGDILYSVERNEWNAQTGNLVRKTIEDPTGTIFHGSTYFYDNNHNVIQESVTGFGTIFRTYSDDGFNLKLTESDRAGKITEYQYLPNTNLLTAEIVRLCGKIVKRTFHFYDDELNSVCIKTIIDDGTSENPEDLTNVSFRRVTESDPKRTLPCLGLSQEVREYGGDQLLKRILYTYHPSGQIESEQHYDANNQYQYTLQNYYDGQERLVAKTDELGYQTTYEYDSRFNLIAQHGPKPDQHVEWRYDLANRPIQQLEWQSDGSILISQQKYDKKNRLITTVDPSGFETHYTYDFLGRLISIEHPDGAIEKKEYDILDHLIKEIDPNGHITQKIYNLRGELTAIQHPDGTQEHFVYYPTNRKLAIHVDTHGVQTKYAYDLLDNLVSTLTGFALTTAKHSPFRLISETDACGETTHITYDLAGRKIGEHKGQKETLYSYNPLGQVCKIQAGDTVTHIKYDLKGQLLEKKIEGIFQENYTYDEAGNKITTTTCLGTTHTTYNSRCEPIQIQDPLGHITKIFYSYEGGLTKTTCDPKNILRVVTHDSRKRPIDLQTKNSKGDIIQREERKYDHSGNQIESTHYLYQGTQLQKTIMHKWCYGPMGRLVQLTESGEKNTHYHYDKLGRLITLIKPDGQSIYREYDHLSRLSHYYGQGLDYTYRYDSKNRLTNISDAIHKTTLKCVYDIYDNLVTEKLDTGIKIRRDYDPYNRCTALHLPDGSTVKYTYKGPYLHTISHNGKTHTYTSRNLSGRPTQITLANQQTLTIDWDPNLRWLHYRTPYSETSYNYDEVGNLISYTTEKEHYCYHYDDLRQLLSEKENHYTYDSLLNRRSKNQQTYQLNALLQITREGETQYQYDKNGNLISDGLHTYEYDLLDRLIAVTKDEKRVTYLYDALNRRLSKENDLYIWDREHEIGMMRNGTIKELRILGEGSGAEIGAAVLLELDKKPYIPIHDTFGSVIQLLTPEGELHQETHFTAFGEGKTISPWGFSSKRHDPETSFIYFSKRYYHPSLGRWITPDPQGFQDGPNLYAYVYNNPLTFCDPLGLIARSLAETHNLFDFCGLIWYYACRTIETFTYHLLPIPGARELIEGTSRWARGDPFFKPREHPCVIPSSGFELPHLSRPYCNGIMTNRESGIKQRDALSKANGGIRIDFLHNPSHGLILDLLYSVLAKCGIKMAYERMEIGYFSSILEEDPEHQFLVTAHSQGCTRINNMSKYLTAEQCQHITIEAFGGATIIPEGRFKDVTNYVSKLDGVPWTSTWSYFKNVVGIDSNVTFLTPQCKNPLTEHFLMSDTYWQQVELLGKDFQKKYLHD